MDIRLYSAILFNRYTTVACGHLMDTDSQPTGIKKTHKKQVRYHGFHQETICFSHTGKRVRVSCSEISISDPLQNYS